MGLRSFIESRFSPGRVDRSTRLVVTENSVPVPHPDALDPVSDSLVLRYPGKRPKYIESWNEHVRSERRMHYYDIVQRAEKEADENSRKGRKDTQGKKDWARARQLDLFDIDINWAILQPTNFYRVAFFAYDHMRGSELVDRQRIALFNRFAAHQQPKKHQTRLQEVEKIYEELMHPQVSWRTEIKSSAKPVKSAQPLAIEPTDPWEGKSPAARAVMSLATLGQIAGEQVGASSAGQDDDAATPEEVDAFIAKRAAERAARTGNMQLDTLKNTALATDRLPGETRGAWRGRVREESMQQTIFRNPVPPRSPRDIDSSRSSHGIGVDRRREVRYTDTFMQPVSLVRGTETAMADTVEEFIEALKDDEGVKGLFLPGVAQRVASLTRMSETELEATYGVHKVTRGTHVDWYKMELNRSQALYFIKQDGRFKVDFY